jgi:hypothetical protein
MLPMAFEKTVATATFEELWHGKLPDFRARNEKRNLKRQGIEVEFVNRFQETITVRAFAETVPQINYLFTREYKKVNLPRKPKIPKELSDIVQTILKRPRTGTGGGIPLTRGEVAMLFLDGYAGDGPDLLDIRSQGYGNDDDGDGLTDEDVMEDSNTVFVWSKWEPLELWPNR